MQDWCSSKIISSEVTEKVVNNTHAAETAGLVGTTSGIMWLVYVTVIIILHFLTFNPHFLNYQLLSSLKLKVTYGQEPLALALNIIPKYITISSFIYNIFYFIFTNFINNVIEYSHILYIFIPLFILSQVKRFASWPCKSVKPFNQSQ